MVIFISWRDGLLINWNSSMGNRWCKSFSDHRYRAVNLNMIEARCFYVGWLLDGHSLDFSRWFHDIHFLESFNRSADNNTSRRDAFVSRFCVFWSWGSRDYTSANLASVSGCGLGEGGIATKADL